MTPERWERISEILEGALAVEGSERADYLDRACAGDVEVRREVESLLLSHEQVESSFLQSPIPAVQSGLQRPPRLAMSAGRKIGSYLVEQEIGRGGMGEVFSAVRADGQYEKKVAIKLVRTGCDTAAVLERFRQERQILAGLDHPNIARLLDGGTTEEGVPYLVMDLVEGAPIDEYCDAAKLKVTERLQLFRQVCAAVQYAHQHLVVHRDIKPSNILVTSEGVPKLLDFGIAKLLDASGSLEVTALHPLTPEYASPEQIRGETVTTTTDVYSLGVVLYRLLTGHSPYRIPEPTPAKLAEAITSDEPESPSTAVQRTESVTRDGKPAVLTPDSVSSTRELSPLHLQRRLRGDLDAIVLKALRKEPSLRYVSVGEFAEDIGNHLEKLPVGARKGTWNYRAGKFIRRHRAAVAAASLVLLTLVTGVIVTLREARIANANRMRAEARFNDLRKLTNSLLFEVHDAIENVPGTTQARKLVLQRSLEYLDTLSKDSGNDPDLLRELATGYRRIGMVQGNPKEQNLGDTNGALASFQKSLDLRQTLVRLNPKNSKDQVQLAIAYLDFSDFESEAAGNAAGAFDYCKKALSILDREVVTDPRNVLILTQSTRGYANAGMLEVGEGSSGRIGTVTGAVADLQKALEIDQRLVKLVPAELSFQAHGALIYGLLGEAMLSLGDRPQALSNYVRAIEILDSLNKKQENIRFISNGAILQGKVGNALLMDGQTSAAIPYFVKAQQTAVQIAARDPDNEFLKEIKVNCTGELGFALVESGRVPEGIGHLVEAIRESQDGLTLTPGNRVAQGTFHVWLGQGLEREGKFREASQEYAAGKALIAEVRAGGTNDLQTVVTYCLVVNRLGSSLLKLGDAQAAQREFDESLLILNPLLNANPFDQDFLYALAETNTDEGSMFMHLANGSTDSVQKLSQWTAAREWLKKSEATWSKISHPSRTTAGGIEVTLPQEVSRRLTICEAHMTALASPSPRGAPAKQ